MIYCLVPIQDIKGQIRIMKTKEDELEKLLETKSTESSKTTFPNPSQSANYSNILKESPARLSHRYDHIVIITNLGIPFCQVLVINQMNPH